MPAQVEETPDSTVHRQETLCLSYGFEPAHLPLSLSCRLMRHLREIVRIARGDMLDRGHHVGVSSTLDQDIDHVAVLINSAPQVEAVTASPGATSIGLFACYGN